MNEIPEATPMFSGSNFLMMLRRFFKWEIQDGCQKWSCMHLGVCITAILLNQGFATDLDIIKSGRPNGIKTILFLGTILYANQEGGRETGSSYNFGPAADRNVISNVTTTS